MDDDKQNEEHLVGAGADEVNAMKELLKKQILLEQRAEREADTELDDEDYLEYDVTVAQVTVHSMDEVYSLFNNIFK